MSVLVSGCILYPVAYIHDTNNVAKKGQLRDNWAWLNINDVTPCMPNSIKVALGIGNCALGSYCLVVTQARHCII